MVNARLTCAEIVYDRVTPPEAAPELAGLAFGSDGTLYVARTAAGEIWALRDEDGDQFMDEPFPVADDLRLPVALAFHDGALYVLSADAVTRLDPSGSARFDGHTVLIDNLGSPTGFWPGSIGIGPDERLYISLGASCALCEGLDEIQPGQIVSYALDGSDRRVEATGLHDPADFAWNPETGDLWVVDSAPVGSEISTSGPPDELNRVTPGADFGFPLCDDAQPADPACAKTSPPSLTFPHQSSPGAVAFYPYDGFAPFWQGDLLVALRGSTHTLEPAGYALMVAGFEGAEPDGSLGRISPDAYRATYTRYSLARLALMGRSFFPYHPADIAVDAQGWIYVSVEEGRIFRFRPRPAAKGR